MCHSFDTCDKFGTPCYHADMQGGQKDMLSERIKTVLEIMDITISDVARAGGCTPSNLNRVKNGVRTPPPSSPTIRLLTEGIMKTAAQRHVTGELVKLCGANLRDSEEVLRSKLVKWLYEDEPPYVRSYQRRKDRAAGGERAGAQPATGFAERLDRLMKTADMSNRRLGREAGLAPSYISRLHRGERMPKYQSAYLMRICQHLIDKISGKGKLSALSELTSITEAEFSGAEGAEELRRWLFGYGPVTDHMAADELMGTIASIDELIGTARAVAAEGYDMEAFLKAAAAGGGTVCSDEMRFTGTDGLRKAVTQFIADVMRGGGNELLLYSDQPMDWMEGGYRQILAALMAELIRRDVRISIIHTVDRSVSELVSAVEWWMPLYLSGNITSYYSMQGSGGRFSHTLFICPGLACVAGTGVTGSDDRTVYHYSRDDEVTGLAEESFRHLMRDCRPLVKISGYSVDPAGNDGYVQTDKVMVRAVADSVTIRRAEPPYLEFTFTHPIIVRAFRSYMDICDN